jgi:hypothetical protein
MAIRSVATTDKLGRGRPILDAAPEPIQTHASAVSWGSIFAGAAAAAALSLILLMLGVGLGLSSVSPWAYEGISAATFGVSTILWISLMQLLASAMGGYLAGRLRTKWLAVPTDEVYFRDTAHGFLAWAIATLATATLLTSVIGSIVNNGIQAGASVAGGVATVATATVACRATAAGSEITKSDSGNGPMGYYLDSLFRKDMKTASAASGAGGNPQQAAAAPLAEVAGIFMNSIRTGNLPDGDVRYVGQIVAQRTGLTQQEAERRVTETYTRVQTTMREAETAAKGAAEKGRKASAYTTLWFSISLLIGAFVASWAAIYGGRRRDA